MRVLTLHAVEVKLAGNDMPQVTDAQAHAHNHCLLLCDLTVPLLPKCPTSRSNDLL